MPEKKSRQYLIDIQKWRSLAALAACVVTLVFSVIAINKGMVEYVRDGEQVSKLFRFFTTLSNMMTALAASFITPFAVNGIRKKRFVMPKWLSMFHFSGAVNAALIFVFAMCFILPFNKEFAIGGNNFYLHIVCPIAVVISFCLVESSHDCSRKDDLVCLIPFLCYSLVYLVMVVFTGRWDDMYMLNTIVPAYVSLPLVWALACGIAFALRKLSDRLTRHRKEKMFASWKEDAEPVEVNIEVYGLGRFYGLSGDRNELGIPYDILESLADRYSMSVSNILKVYMKGLSDGLRDRDLGSQKQQ